MLSSTRLGLGLDVALAAPACRPRRSRPSALVAALKGSWPPPGTPVVGLARSPPRQRWSLARRSECASHGAHLSRDNLSLSLHVLLLKRTTARPATESRPLPARSIRKRSKLHGFGRVRARAHQQEQAHHRLRRRAHHQQAERGARGPVPVEGVHLGLPREPQLEPRRQRRRQRRALHQPLVQAATAGSRWTARPRPSGCARRATSARAKSSPTTTTPKATR